MILLSLVSNYHSLLSSAGVPAMTYRPAIVLAFLAMVGFACLSRVSQAQVPKPANLEIQETSATEKEVAPEKQETKKKRAFAVVPAAKAFPRLAR